MKKYFLCFMCFILLSCMTFNIKAQTSDCVPTSVDPNSLPYPIDNVLVLGDLLGSRTQIRGVLGSMTGHCCDPDGDAIAVKCDGGLPPGMTFNQTDPNGTYQIKGSPTSSGTYYIHLTATDSPKAPLTALSRSATIVWFVLNPNNPPVFKGCGSSYVN